MITRNELSTAQILRSFEQFYLHLLAVDIQEMIVGCIGFNPKKQGVDRGQTQRV